MEAFGNPNISDMLPIIYGKNTNPHGSTRNSTITIGLFLSRSVHVSNVGILIRLYSVREISGMTIMPTSNPFFIRVCGIMSLFITSFTYLLPSLCSS